MRKLRSLGTAFVVLTMFVAGQSAAQTRAKMMIEGGRIVPVVGKVIEKGNILIEDGRIVAIGEDLKAPYDAKVIDASGKTIFPGLVDAWTSDGLDVSNESQDVAPFTEVFDSLDPSDRYFEEALRQGLTTLHLSHSVQCVIGGLSRVVHPIGMTVDEMTQRAEGGLMISVYPKRGYDHSVQRAILRDTFADLDRYLDDLAETRYAEEQKKKDEKVTVSPEEARKLGKELIRESDIDRRYLNLWRLRHQKIDAYVWAARAMDVAPALALAEQQKFSANMSLVTGPECFKNMKALKTLKRPVILPSDFMVFTERDRISLKETDTFVPKVYADKKLPFALSGMTKPFYDAARLVRNGISQQTALEAITINGARAIGMEHLVGSLEVGKLANILILTGDPLDAMTWVDGVVVNGVQVYDRKKDVRLRELLLGIAETDLIKEAKKAEAKKEEKPAEADASKNSKPATDGAEKK